MILFNENTAQLVVIPDWVEQILIAHGKPLSTALNVMELSNILMGHDVAFYIALNSMCYERPALTNIVNGFERFDFFTELSKCNPTMSNKEALSYYDDIVCKFKQRFAPGNSAGDLVNAIAGYELVKSKGPNLTHEVLIELCVIRDGVFGLRFKEFEKGESPLKQLRLALYNANNLLSKYYEINKVCHYGVFKLYTMLLRHPELT